MAGILFLAACSPTYDWRDVRGSGVPFVVAMPAKPSVLARPIDLEGLPVTMTMTAAEVEGVTFAVGAIELADPGQAGKALQSMKAAMVRNVGGAVRKESVAGTTTQIEAAGQGRLLLGRFTAHGKHVYQLIVVGKESAVQREQADTFFTSFKPG